MKKGLLAILIIFVFAAPVFAQDEPMAIMSPIVVNFNAGNFGFGLNFPINNRHDFEAHFSLINIGVESTVTNIGMSFSPFMLVTWMSLDDSYNDSELLFGGIFLLNAMVYWNVFNYTFGSGFNFFIGPFASANYLLVEDDFFFDNYIFTLGVQMGLRTNHGRFQYNLFSFELGYRNINGNHNYYIGGKFDIVTVAIASVFSTPRRWR